MQTFSSQLDTKKTLPRHGQSTQPAVFPVFNFNGDSPEGPSIDDTKGYIVIARKSAEMPASFFLFVPIDTEATPEIDGTSIEDDFGAQFLSIKERTNINKSQLAKIFNVSRQTIHSWEAGGQSWVRAENRKRVNAISECVSVLPAEEQSQLGAFLKKRGSTPSRELFELLSENEIDLNRVKSFLVAIKPKLKGLYRASTVKKRSGSHSEPQDI